MIKRIHHDILDSTNAQALRMASDDFAEPVLIHADTQTAGRGRNGRTWQSPHGGAWMSLLWPVTRNIEHYTAVPLVAGLATMRAIQRLIEKFQCKKTPQIQIKWPNDVLLDDRKVAGILCETACKLNRVTHLVIGVGINVSFDVKTLNGNLRHTPTTLRKGLGKLLAVEDVVEAFAAQISILMRRYEEQGLSPGMLRELRSSLAYVGQKKTWQFAGESVEGRIMGIDHTGGLILECQDRRRIVDYGEINAPEAHLANV